MITNRWMRLGVYVVLVALGGAAVIVGVATQGQVDQYVAIIMGLVGMVGGGTALGHLNPKPEKIGADDVAAMIGDAIGQVQAAAAPVVAQALSRAEQVDQARRDLEARLGGGR